MTPRARTLKTSSQSASGSIDRRGWSGSGAICRTGTSSAVKALPLAKGEISGQWGPPQLEVGVDEDRNRCGRGQAEGRLDRDVSAEQLETDARKLLAQCRGGDAGRPRQSTESALLRLRELGA